MAITSPILNLLYIETHDLNSMGVADGSIYPTGFMPVNPSIQITAPNFPSVLTTFQANNLNIFNSDTVGVTCNYNGIYSVLPDGIYVFTYTINPAYQYFVTKSFLRTNLIQAKYDEAFLRADISECLKKIRRQDREYLTEANLYIQKSIAAANKCASDLSMELYRKADKMLNDFLRDRTSYNFRDHAGLY
jgi:hypothetical protein